MIDTRSLTIFGTPDSGESSMTFPAFSTAARSASFSFMASVLSSMITSPLRPAFSTPCGPSSTSRTSSYVGRTVTMTSHASAIALGETAGRPPMPRNSCIGERRYPWTPIPLAMKFAASGSPMAPSPINPTLSLMAVFRLPFLHAGGALRQRGPYPGPPVRIRTVALGAAGEIVRSLHERVVVERHVERLGEGLLDVPRRVHEGLEVVALGVGEVQAPGQAVIDRRDRLDAGIQELGVEQ